MYIGNQWDEYLNGEYLKPYFRNIESYLTESYRDRIILPKKENIFKAFKYTDFNSVKCVILGQDPYPTVGHACGLAFSVNKNISFPRSLQNIFRELRADLNIPYPAHGNLTSWANEGVLLLNTTLTVEAGKPNSHKDLGWDIFTNEAIRVLSKNRKDVVFLLWGKAAQSKKYMIDSTKHLILQTSHPSPHSASLGFLGCKHFSKVNNYLSNVNKEIIDWTIK